MTSRRGPGKTPSEILLALDECEDLSDDDLHDISIDDDEEEDDGVVEIEEVVFDRQVQLPIFPSKIL